MSVEILRELVNMNLDNIHIINRMLRRIAEELENLYRKNLTKLVVEKEKLFLFGLKIDYDMHPKLSLMLSKKIFIQDRGLINILNNLLSLSSMTARSPLFAEMKRIAYSFLINEELINNGSMAIVPNLTTWEAYLRDPLYDKYYNLFEELRSKGVLGEPDEFYGVRHFAEFLFKACYFNLDLITGDQLIVQLLEKFIDSIPAQYRIMVKTVRFKDLPNLNKFSQVDHFSLLKAVKSLKLKDLELIHRKVDPEAIKRYLKVGKVEYLDKEFGKFGHDHVELSYLKSVDKSLELLPIFTMFKAYYMPKTSLFDLFMKKIIHDLKDEQASSAVTKKSQLLKLSEISRECKSQIFIGILE